jgi:hypothetical protein
MDLPTTPPSREELTKKVKKARTRFMACRVQTNDAIATEGLAEAAVNAATAALDAFDAANGITDGLYHNCLDDNQENWDTPDPERDEDGNEVLQFAQVKFYGLPGVSYKPMCECDCLAGQSLREQAKKQQEQEQEEHEEPQGKKQKLN